MPPRSAYEASVPLSCVACAGAKPNHRVCAALFSSPMVVRREPIRRAHRGSAASAELLRCLIRSFIEGTIAGCPMRCLHASFWSLPCRIGPLGLNRRGERNALRHWRAALASLYTCSSSFVSGSCRKGLLAGLWDVGRGRAPLFGAGASATRTRGDLRTSP